MLLQSLKEMIPITPKISSFQYNRYLYTDIVKIVPDTVMDLLYIAKKYCVDLLAKSCSEFLQDKISPENVCHILEAAHRISDTDIYDKCMAIVKENYTSSIKSKGFLSLSRDSLQNIVQLDGVLVKEEELYEHVIKWAEAECLRQKLEISSWENKRKVLGNVLFKVRFPLIDMTYFAKNVGVTELLTSEEKVDILLYYASNKDVVVKYFQSTERIKTGVPVQVCRFSSEFMEWGVGKGGVDAISFQSSNDSLLHGILIYGCCSVRSCKYSVDIRLKDINNKELTKLTTTVNTMSSQKIYEVKFDSALRLKAGATYTIEIEMVGNNTHRGNNGNGQVFYGNGKSVTFMAAPSSGNGTDVSHGQFPGLLLG